MTITEEKFREITKQYSTLLVLEEDAEEALNFVHDLLLAEADAVKESYPYATNTIKGLEEAAYQVFELAQEVAAG